MGPGKTSGLGQLFGVGPSELMASLEPLALDSVADPCSIYDHVVMTLST